MGEVADDGDVPAGEVPEPLLHRVRVEERLGRVLVGAVPGVDDVDVDPLADLLRGAAGTVCRMTSASTPIAATVRAVSRSRRSPLEVEDPLPEMLMTSADSHLPAISNELRVRVESSKKRLTTVRPRRVGAS